MPLDFPSSPTNGQKYGQYVYDSSLPGWRNVNTTEANTLIQVGMVPIVPSSVTTGSGSATVATDGTITLTNAGYCLANNVFSTAYRNYLIKMTLSHSSGDYLAFRMTSGGGPNTTANYYTVGNYISGGTSANVGAQPADSFSRIGYTSTTYTNSTYDVNIYNPKVADQTTWNVIGGYSNIGYWYRGLFNTSDSFDGFMILPQNTGNYNGTLKVYGYR